MERSLAYSLERMGFRFEPIGPVADYYGAVTPVNQLASFQVPAASGSGFRARSWISHVDEACACEPGATQRCFDGDPSRAGHYEPLSLGEVAERIKNADKHSPADPTGATGESSTLPGMVPKIVLHRVRSSGEQTEESAVEPGWYIYAMTQPPGGRW